MLLNILWYYVCIIDFVRFLTLSLLFLAQISFPLDNVTYWSSGSLVKLPWTYNFSDILVVEVWFVKPESIKGVNVSLAKSYDGTNVTSKDPSKFTIEGQATLVFKNANISDNGTYSLAVTLRGGAGQQRSEVKVVILGEKNVTNFIIYTIKLIYNCCTLRKIPMAKVAVFCNFVQ